MRNAARPDVFVPAPAVPDPPPAHAPARARRPRRRKTEEPVNHDRWLVSYADFVTLLFAFFTTMYAISRVDAEKLSVMVQSMQQAFQPGRVVSGPPAVAVDDRPQAPAPPAPALPFEQLRSNLADQLAKLGIQDWVDLEIDDRGLVISMREVGSFGVGSADLSPAGQDLLRYIGGVLAGLDNHVRIEGHTDDVPIHTARFTSNWQLSAARATNVVAFLLENTGTRPDRVSVAGYAEHHPRVSNDSEAGRSRNRRVDLVILSPATASEEPRAREDIVP
jgi:chemotaxis protein MotB